MKKKSVWVVTHCEYMGTIEHPHIDEMVFCVSSSLKAAESYIRSIGVDPHSWWLIQNYEIDIDDGGDMEQHFYSHKGKSLKQPPYKYAEYHFKQKRKREKVK